MFTLQDGREHLYQWDLDRYVVVNDSTICEVHFCNRTADCSLVVEVKDGLAAIPNILLQDARPIRVYAYCDDSYTLTEQQFTVKSRTKPADYVYTETEILQYSTLGNRINELQEQVEKVDVSNFYTKAETDTAIEEAKEVYYFDFSNVSTTTYTDAPEEQQAVFNRLHNGEQLTIYVRDTFAYAVADIHVTSNIITLVVHFTDAFSTTQTTIIRYVASLYQGVWGVKQERKTVNDFTTKQYVDDAIANIDIPEADVDLSNYYTKSEVDTKIEQATIGDVDLSNYYTKEETINEIKRTKSENDVAQQTDIDDLKRRVTAIENIAKAEEGSY